MHHRPAELMRQQRRDHAKLAAQTDDVDAVLLDRLLRQLVAGQPLVRVDVVDDGDVVAARGERARRALHIDAVAAEVERRIERRQRAEPQPGHQIAASAIRTALAMSVKVMFFAGRNGNVAPSTRNRFGMSRLCPSGVADNGCASAVIGTVPA